MAGTRKSMRWGSVSSDHPLFDDALEEVLTGLRACLESEPPALILVFVSAHHAPSFDRLSAVLQLEFPGAVLLGCSAGSVIGGGEEIEGRPGLSLTGAILPDVQVVPFHVGSEGIPDPNDGVEAWEKLIGSSSADEPHFILLSDPFSFDPVTFLKGLDQAYPQSSKIGGLASGSHAPGNNRLYLGRDVHLSGLVGVALAGDIALDVIVAQGARSIGDPIFITHCSDNEIFSLDGVAALPMLQQIHDGLEGRDRDLFRQGLLLGVVMRDMEESYGAGDFLMRQVVGINPDAQSLIVAADLRGQQVVQFHLRDASSASRELVQLLKRHQVQAKECTGALLFSCLGRGEGFYGEPNHDSRVFREQLGDIPIGGFFCNGEIGPVQGVTHVHGYTSAFGLFRSSSGGSLRS